MAEAAALFNQIPSNLVAPIFAAEINSGGQPDQPRRMVVIGHKSAAGSAAANAVIPIASRDAAAQAFGFGSMLYDMVRVALLNAPAVPLVAIAIDDTGAAPVWTLTFANIPANIGTAYLDLNGYRLQVAVTAADTVTTVAAALAAAINAAYDPLTAETLPVTATSAAGVVTLTGRHKGVAMNDLDIFVPAIVGNPLSVAGVLTTAQTTAGSGTPSIATALANLGDDPADMVVSPFSDATSLAAADAWANDASGRWAWNRLSFGHYFTSYTGNFAAQITLGQSLNNRHISVIRRQAAVISPGWLWAAAHAAAEVTWLFDDVNGNVARNQSARPVYGVRGLRDRSGLDTYNAENQLNSNGISTWRQDMVGQVQIGKSVTTQRTGVGNQPDSTFRDIQSVFQVQIAVQYLRSVFFFEHGNKAIADDNPGNLPAVSTPRDILATFLHGLTELERRGVIENVDRSGRQLTVARDQGNPARVNVVAKIDRTNPLDILALNAIVYAQFPRA